MMVFRAFTVAAILLSGAALAGEADVVDAMCDADMVRKAVRIRPLLTVKG